MRAFHRIAAVALVVGLAPGAVHGCSSEEPSPVDLVDPTNPNGTSNGSFLSRDKLDVCLIAGGGQVVFDPPIDLANYPPSPLADPVTYKTTFNRPKGRLLASSPAATPGAG